MYVNIMIKLELKLIQVKIMGKVCNEYKKDF